MEYETNRYEIKRWRKRWPDNRKVPICLRYPGTYLCTANMISKVLRPSLRLTAATVASWPGVRRAVEAECDSNCVKSSF